MSLTTRRRLLGSLVALAAAGVLAAAMLPFRSHLSVATTALVLVVPVVGGVVVGGFAAGVVAVAGGFLVYDVLFIPPYGTLTVGATQNWVALGVYVAVMLIVAQVVAQLEATRRAVARRELTVRRLFELSELLVAEQDEQVLPTAVVHSVRDTFNLGTVALLRPGADGLVPVAVAGEPLSADELAAVVPRPGVPVAAGLRSGGDLRAIALAATGEPVGLLAVRGRELGPDDAHALRTFANHLALSLERAALRRQALRAEVLEQTERLQQALVGAVSHDLRTPLAAIKVAASTLLHNDARVAPGDRKELLDTIDAQADRLGRLVTNLLDLSRVQAGVLRVVPQPTAVSELVADAVQAVQSALGAHRVELDLPDDLPLVDADPVLAGQVLANLLDNAARFAPDGTAITVQAALHDDGLVHVAVRDGGPGVAPALRNRVFEPFARSGPGGGTGVGLAIAKAFVEAHGQRIWVEEAAGGGASFVFTLSVTADPAGWA
jgi:two-component system sensor histidine kinase KdpD